MANDRIQETLEFIGRECGQDDRRHVEAQLEKLEQRGLDLREVDASLSIGGFRGGLSLFKSEEQTQQRACVRAVLLTDIADGRLALGNVDARKDTLMHQETHELQNELRHQFPFKAFPSDVENRGAWRPENFSDPMRHDPNDYVYVVHGVQKEPSIVAGVMPLQPKAQDGIEFKKQIDRFGEYAEVDSRNRTKTSLKVDFMAQYLDRPETLAQKVISASVISQDKHATYHPIGFVLKVPPECVYITSRKDAEVANRAENLVHELESVQKKTSNSTIRTPGEILAATLGEAGKEHYNEITLAGTSPEGRHRQVEVAAIYVKTDLAGNLYVNPATDLNPAGRTPYVDARTQDMIIEAALKHNLPIVGIPDATCHVIDNPVPWPFGDAQRIVHERTHTGPPEPSEPDHTQHAEHDLTEHGPDLRPRAPSAAARAYDGTVVGIDNAGHVHVAKLGAQSRQGEEKIHLGNDHGLRMGQVVHVCGEPGARQVAPQAQVHAQQQPLRARL